MVDRQDIRANDQLGLPLSPTLECVGANQALVESDRSFFDTAAHLRMPTDPITGLPHAILSPDLSYDPTLPDVNYHHHFYNRRHEDLEGDLAARDLLSADPSRLTLEEIAGLAVRMSRGQRLPIVVHKMTHDLYPMGPVLPHTIDEKFTVAVKACAGVVSRWAIDVTSHAGPELVWMDDPTFDAVASSKLLCTERVYHDRPANHRRKVIGNFFLRYAINQDLSHISTRAVENFLSPKDETMRRSLGNFILMEAMDVVIDPVEPVYQELGKQGMVQPGRSLNIRSAVKKYIHPEQLPRMHSLLHQKLAVA